MLRRSLGCGALLAKRNLRDTLRSMAREASQSRIASDPASKMRGATPARRCAEGEPTGGRTRNPEPGPHQGPRPATAEYAKLSKRTSRATNTTDAKKAPQPPGSRGVREACRKDDSQAVLNQYMPIVVACLLVWALMDPFMATMLFVWFVFILQLLNLFA